MEETIYQDVWCRVFAKVCATEKQNWATIDRAKNLADWAAYTAVQMWNEAQRLAAITAKNKGNK